MDGSGSGWFWGAGPAAYRPRQCVNKAFRLDTGDGASGAIRGRLECGDRQATLKFVARFEDGSTELTKLKDQSVGTATIELTYDANNKLTLTFHRNSFAVAEVGDTDGLVTVSVECLPQYDSVNGVLSAVALSNTDGIAQ